MPKNPKVNRAIGYAVMFTGFILFYKGFHIYAADTGANGINIVMVVIAIALVTGAVVWMFRTVRCPHCGALLHLKLCNIDVCPECGKSTGKTDDNM